MAERGGRHRVDDYPFTAKAGKQTIVEVARAALGESVKGAKNFGRTPGPITGLVGELDDDFGLDKRV